MNFKVGDPVHTYGHSQTGIKIPDRTIGEIVEVFDRNWVQVLFNEQFCWENYTFHVKQLRKLRPKIKKKEPRAIWVWEYSTGDLSKQNFLEKPDISFTNCKDRLVKFIEIEEVK
jgi:hypothetical protein